MSLQVVLFEYGDCFAADQADAFVFVFQEEIGEGPAFVEDATFCVDFSSFRWFGFGVTEIETECLNMNIFD